jgi:hypothetical protein
MTEEKILEIADKYDTGDIYGPAATWNFITEDLIAFAEAVIETEREQTAIKVPTVVWDKLKDVNTVTDLIKALKGDTAMSMQPEWTATCKLRWFNPFPYDRCKLQQEWVNQYGETEWRDVPTEE